MRLRFSIGQRTTLGFVLMIALVLVASGAGLFYSRSVDRTVDESRQGLDQFQAISDLQVSWLSVTATLDSLLLTRQTSLIDGELAQGLAAFESRLAALRQTASLQGEMLSAENEPIVSRLETLGDRLTGIAANLSAAAQDGQWARAQVLRHTDLASVHRQFDEQLDLLVTNVETDVHQALQDTMDTQTSAQRYWTILAVLAVVIGMAAAFLTVTSITRPLAALLGVVQGVRAGDLSQRAPVRGRDEIAELASTFNYMTSQLQAYVGSLEARVAARTQDLFRTLQVGELATQALREEDLLLTVTDYIREQFGLYYVQVYLLDEGKRYALLRSGTGEVGEQLLAGGHKLDLGETSIVARAVHAGKPVLVTDTGASDIHKKNALLPDTRSEVAIPLRVGQETLGVLDMQATTPGTFNPENLAVFEAMANQIAASLRSAQAYQQVERAMDRADAINRRLTREYWEDYLGRVAGGARVKVRYDLRDVTADYGGGTGLLTPPIGNGSNALARTITLRGEPIGQIVVAEDGGRGWAPDDADLIQGVAERVALALEQFRAFNELEIEADRRAQLYEIGQRLAESLEPAVIAQGAVEGLARLIDVPEVSIFSYDDDTGLLTMVGACGPTGERMRGLTVPLEQSPGAAHVIQQRAIEAEVDIAGNPTPENEFARSMGFTASLLLPIQIADRVTGVLILNETRGPRAFGADEMMLIQNVAFQVGIALQNAYLYQEQVEVADQLRTVDRLKSEFMASMSHELRTPLNSVIGYAEVLLDGIDGPLNDDMYEDVATIHSSGRHLLNLINDVLDLAKIESGQMDLHVETVSLSEAAQDVAMTARVLLGDKPVELVIDIDEQVPDVHADPLRLRQILNNLVANAIKFTEEGSVTVRAGRTAGDPAMLTISVVDTGIGISAEHLPLVFERFRQVDQSATRRVGGTGLGLAITRQLVEMHGGEIWLESEPDVGSTFSFTVPVATVPEAQT